MKGFLRFLGLLGIALVALIGQVAILVYPFKPAPLVVIVLMVGVCIAAFRLISMRWAIVFTVLYLLFNAMIMPHVRQGALNPYLEAAASHIRTDLEEAHKRDGHFPADVTPYIERVADEFKLDNRLRGVLRSRPYKYDPSTGEFTWDYY